MSFILIFLFLSIEKVFIDSEQVLINGRFTIPETPKQLRVCRQCDANCVGDEIHFIVINCQKHNELNSQPFYIKFF